MKKTKDKKKILITIFLQVNPDAEGFDIFFEISKIEGYIAQSNKKQLKK